MAKYSSWCNMKKAKKHSSNTFKPKINAINIVILGAIYSWGSCASAQTISTNTDITGKNVTDGVNFSASAGGSTLNINGGSKITGTADSSYTAPVWIDFPSDPSQQVTVNISGKGTAVVGANNGIQAARTTGTTINITDGARVEGVSGSGIYIHDDYITDTSMKLNVDNSSVSGAFSGVYIWDNEVTANISGSQLSGDRALIMAGTQNNVMIKDSMLTAISRSVNVSSSVNSAINIGHSSLISDNIGLCVVNSEKTDIVVDHTSIQAGNNGIYYYMDKGDKQNDITIKNESVIDGKNNGIKGDDNNGEANSLTVNNSTINSTEGNGVLLGGDYTLSVNEGSTVTGNNAIVLNGDTKATTVNVKDSTVTGKTNLLQFSGTSAVDTVDFSGSTLSGAITTSSGADQSVNIDSSAWNGSAGKTGTGALALNISNGSTWINNAATDVDTISLTGASTIVMDGGNIHTASLSDTAPTTLLAAASPTSSTIYSTYNAETGSAYVLSADKATGSFNAGVTSNSSGAAGDMTGNTIVQVTDGSGATFNSMQSDVGVYRYESRRVANADGSTSVILDNITPEPTPDPAPGPNPNPDSRTLSTAAQAVVNTRAAAMSIWSDEQDVLNRRLDNERLTGSSDGTVNAWGSYYGGYHRQQVEQTSSAYDQTNNGFMLGADKRVDIAPGNLLFGFAATRGYSDVNMHDGGSAGTDVDSYGASLYTSLRLNNGLFFDASIKGTHLKNDISVTSLDGGHTTGDYNNNGFGGAFKTGYHKQFNAWYVEPYAQISYARYNSVDYKLKNGLHTKDDGSTSLGLEGGVNVGTAMALNNGTEVRPYVHLAVAGETENSNTMDINGEKINDSTDGSRGIVGLGADVKLSKNLSGWAGANYAKGQDHYESPWQLNAGVSYTW